jgi:hypothetical protein
MVTNLMYGKETLFKATLFFTSQLKINKLIWLDFYLGSTIVSAYFRTLRANLHFNLQLKIKIWRSLNYLKTLSLKLWEKGTSKVKIAYLNVPETAMKFYFSGLWVAVIT